MHIGIDAHQVGTQLGGNASYISGLITALGSIDTNNQYTLYTTEAQGVRNLVSGFNNFKVRLVRPRHPVVRIPFSMNLVLRKEPVDVLLVQYTAPPFAPCRVVSVIHDISYEHIPETFRVAERVRMKLSISQTARSADGVLVPSEYTRQDIITTYKLRPEKVHMVPLAADEIFMRVTDPTELDRVSLKYDLKPGFILGLGSIQPRKNYARLIEAYVSLGCKPNEVALVIVGMPGWKAEHVAEIEAKVADLAKRGRENKLSLEEMSGGTFTITNGGVFGSLMSTPIINVPQAAILGMHKIQERPVVIDDQIAVRPMMYVALSYDHRIIDGRESVSFLVRVKELLEHPEQLLIGGDPIKEMLSL